MTIDDQGAVSLVRNHLRQIEPPPGAKARASLQLEERIARRASGVRRLGALGLAGVFVAGASLAAANQSDWFRSEPEASPPAKVSVTAAPKAPSGGQHGAHVANAPPLPATDEGEPELPRDPQTRRLQRRPEPAKASTADSSLAKQVAEFQAAMAHAERDDQRALSELRAFKRRWKHSPLNHEADIEIVAALQRLGRDEESKAAARRFVQTHPESAKAAEMKALAKPKEPKAP
jgi:TolA-binding protein